MVCFFFFFQFVGGGGGGFFWARVGGVQTDQIDHYCKVIHSQFNFINDKTLASALAVGCCCISD